MAKNSVRVSAKIIEELTKGSYEHQINRVEEAVEELNQRDATADWNVVGTFKNIALLANQHGDFVRAHYRSQDDGRISFVQMEELDVPVVSSPIEGARFLASAVNEAADSFMSGDRETARGLMRDLLYATELFEYADPVEAVKDRLEDIMDPTRPWRRFYENHIDEVHKLLWGSDGYVPNDRLRPKYLDVHTEGVSERDVAGFGPAVMSDLGRITTRLKDLQTSTTKSMKICTECDGELAEKLGESSGPFNEFATDLLMGLNEVTRLAGKLTESEDIRCMATTYDVIASTFHEFEASAKLVQKVCNEI